MKSLRIVSLIILLHLACNALGEKKAVEFLHCNLFKDYHGDSKQYEKEKQQLVSVLIQNKEIGIYSFLENSKTSLFADSEILSNKDSYTTQRFSTSDLKHTLYFDNKRFSIQESKVHRSKSISFFYHKITFADVDQAIHLFVYKQSHTVHPIVLHQEILDYINTKKLKGEFILMGGSIYPIKLLKEAYIKPNVDNVEFVNTDTHFHLYDNDNKFIWHDNIDFAYASKGLWLGTESSIFYRNKNVYTPQMKEAFDSVSSIKNLPIYFTLALNSNTQENIYKTPSARIITQNAKELDVDIVWDQDINLNIEVVSMIGNSFFQTKEDYKGIRKNLKIDLSQLPTGIYLLKVKDVEGNRIFRKFTKY